MLTPPPSVTFCHTSRDPRKVRHTSRTHPQFLVVQKTGQNSLFKSLSMVRGFCSGLFVWKVLSEVGFARPPFCQNTSVTTENSGVHMGVRGCDGPGHPAWGASNDGVFFKKV